VPAGGPGLTGSVAPQEQGYGEVETGPVASSFGQGLTAWGAEMGSWVVGRVGGALDGLDRDSQASGPCHICMTPTLRLICVIHAG